MKTASKELATYFPNKEMGDPEEEPRLKAEWIVISCDVDELASRLRKLPKPVSVQGVARWENQVTVIIKESDAL